MIKRGIIYSLIYAILISLALIQLGECSLTMNPNPISITEKINTPTNFTLTLTNTFSFNIENFEFKNISGFSFPSIVLSPNETRTISFSVNRNNLESSTYQVPVSFTYLVDIPSSPQVYNINITSSGFSPNFMTIHQGDTVIWKNIDDVSHTVTGSDYDQELTPGDTFTHIFTSIATETYQDLNLFWGGEIRVLSSSSAQEVNNPNYDQILTVNLNVISNPTTLSTSLIDNSSFNIKYTKTADGLISIQNNGNETANKVNLFSNSSWISFSNNLIDLDQGQKKYVTFTINPFVMYTNDTNHTYSIPIYIQGLNTPKYVETISLFVPYEDLDNNVLDPSYLIKIIENFCKNNPNNAFCNTSSIGNNTKIIVQDPNIPLNLTASQFYTMLKNNQGIKDSVQRTSNSVTKIGEFVDTTYTNISNSLSKLSNDVGALKDERETTTRIFWIAGIFITIIASFLSIWKLIEKYKYKKYLGGE